MLPVFLLKYCIFLAVVVHLARCKLTIKVQRPNDETFHKLPRFWINTGFCPMGDVNNGNISAALLSGDVETNLDLIGALPNGALSSVRVHWLLELVEFVGLQEHGVPNYNFSRLDRFVEKVDKAGLALGFEFMGCPNGVFDLRNVSREFLWEDLTFQIVRRYLKFYGVDKILNWRFESWNEPDLKTYNKLNFSVTEYINYIYSLRRGLDAAGRTARNVKFRLLGPAGLFKSPEHHPLCWSILDHCNSVLNCPLDVLSFHRKGQGAANDVLSGTKELLSLINSKFKHIAEMEFSNTEADPIAGWSTPRPFQSDVRYAVILVSIILKYWSARLNLREFRNLQSISHDNAFLSYHPHEFDQRTLLARFQMNLTNPPHSQFIQKPVYAALGLLGNLGPYAKDTEYVDGENMTSMETSNHVDSPMYFAYMLLKEEGIRTTFNVTIDLNKIETSLKETEYLAYIIEEIQTDVTDPVKVWKFYGKPNYPNATIREQMRRAQGPVILQTQILKHGTRKLRIPVSVRPPWVMLLRMCSSDVDPPLQPKNFRIKIITKEEVLLIWNEIYRPERCILTYEIYFSKHSKNEWALISEGWHVPFLSFQFKPKDGDITGSYKVRGCDLFGRRGNFSKIQLL